MADDIPLPWGRIVFVIVIGLVLIQGVGLLFGGPDSLPLAEGQNTEQAHKWFMDTHTEGW